MATENFYKFEPDFIIPPGDTLRETLEELEISQAELARRSGRPKKTINGIISGDKSITSDTAVQFERVLGVPASFWNNLEKDYRESVATLEEEERLEEELDWLENFPIKEMIKRNWIDDVDSKVEQFKLLLSYFGVATKDAWQDVWDSRVAFRRSRTFRSNPYAISAWIRKGEIEATNRTLTEFDKNLFHQLLSEIRELTIEKKPDNFMPRLISLCSQAGVAVEFQPELPECRVSGATKWINSKKPLILLSARHKSNDHLWFTFFHEAAHILLHGKKMIFIEGIENEKLVGEEDEANRFAADVLIPPKRYKEFLKNNPISKQKVVYFAREIGIAPGIVVGRLQKDGVIPYKNLNGLKNYYKWDD